MTGHADFGGFEEFVLARRGALLRTAFLLTGNHHDAEDLVQSALIKVAHPNRGCRSWGLKPPVSSRLRAM